MKFRIKGELINRVYYKEGNPHGVGHCWHCGKPIVRWVRTRGEGAWHVDHWPVMLRDIQGQLWIGVTEADDITNLVPSCIECNTSHRHEQTMWHGRSQVRMTRESVMTLFVGMLMAHMVFRA